MSSPEVSDYQKVAALLSLDIQVYAISAVNNPHLAEKLMADLEKRRVRVIEDVDYREMRYAASQTVFNIATEIPDLEESGE